MDSSSPTSTTGKSLLRVLSGERVSPPPIWLMRQAGRYLPEYRKTRKQAGSFLDLCYNPELAAEVTLQPIRRYGLDASILFADILIVPDALGQKVWFEEGEGPKLEPVTRATDLDRLEIARTDEKFGKIHETIRLLRRDLPSETTLIGFCGAPWTVATYMVGGRGSPDQAAARLWAYRQPRIFKRLVTLLVDTSFQYLCGQIKAGAEVVQIFDSWAGSLPDDEFRRWVIDPTRALVQKLKEAHPEIPVIGFPRGAGPLTRDFVRRTGVDGVSCDTALQLSWIRRNLQNQVAVQGNLDPLLLIAGGAGMTKRVRQIIKALEKGPHIFNLGHGITPQTPPDNVARLVELVREGCG